MDTSKFKSWIKKFNIKVLVVLYIIVYTISPLVNQATSTFLTTYFYMGVVVVTVIFTFVACGLKNIREYVSLLVPFVLFELLQMLTADKSNMLLLGYRVLLFMLPVCLGYFLINNSDNMNLYAYCVIIVYSITLVTTIAGCINNPNAARVLATTATSQDPTAVNYNWQNIGGFSFVYSCTLLYPLVILALKQKRIHFIFAVIFAIAIFSLAVNTEYTISLMLVLVTSMLLFLPKDLSAKKLFLLGMTAVFLAFVFSSVVVMLLNAIAGLIGNNTMGEKLVLIFSGEEAINSYDDKRLDRYLTSLTVFFKNPLFGSFLTGEKVGGHSFILDNLAEFGLMGGTLLFFMYRGIYKCFYKPYAEKTGSGYIVWLFVAPIFLSFINPGMWLDNHCLFFPMILNLIFSSDTDSLKKKSLDNSVQDYSNSMQTEG